MKRRMYILEGLYVLRGIYGEGLMFSVLEERLVVNVERLS